MKTIAQRINESRAARKLNEAKKSVANDIPDCPIDSDDDYAVQPSIDACYSVASDLEDVNKNMTLLKKVKGFKGYDQRKLHDYAICLEQVAAWINGVMSLAEDDIPEAATYVNMVKNLGTDNEECKENSAQNCDPSDFDSIQDDQDIYDYFDDIFNNWNDVSKAIFKKSWN